MPILTVITNDNVSEVPFSQADKSSVRGLLEAANIWVRSGCQGNGACGLCRVQIITGDIHGPTKSELLTLSPEQLDRRVRLACQLTPNSDLCIRITSATPGWQDLVSSPCTPSRLRPANGGRSVKAAYGLAVDLGTTNVSLSLWDLARGHRLAGRTGWNPQACYGADIVTRLIAAGRSQENAGRLAWIARDAIREAARDMCLGNGIDPGEIGRVAIVGNTAMLALLTETDAQPLLQPDHWTKPFHCHSDESENMARVMGISPRAAIDIIDPLAGFIGSDLLAGVVATRLTDRPGGLLIDFGTNSEMALWDGESLWVTSAAGGPAFEGGQIHCGMPAEAGAVYSIDEGSDSTGLCLRVIGGGEPKGLCGSGLIDLVATLRGRGYLTATGNLTARNPGDSFVVRGGNHPIRLTKRDVDTLQRAKAAICAGIKTLLASARMSAGDLSCVCVCGAFGQHLNVRNAQAIGLLPETRPDLVELCGNTALAGCEHLLLSPMDLDSIRVRTKVINLAQSSDFETIFLESLYLQPLKVGGQ